MKNIRFLSAFSLLSLAFLTSCEKNEVESKPPPRPIAWIKTVSSDLSQVRRISGILQAQESTSLSFEVSGKVESVSVKLGDSIKKGQLMAELDKSSYQLNNNSADSSLQEAKARQDEVRKRYQRISDLLEQGFASKAEFDNAKAELDSANSAVEVAQSRLELSQKDLRNTRLLAPYDGKITARLIEPSQQISAGQTVFNIEGKQGLEISVMVPETMIGYLENGQTHKSHFPALPDLLLDAQIAEIGSQAETANAYPVTLLINEQNINLRAGMTAEVDFTFSGRGLTGYTGETVRIPLSAILAGDGQNNYVFVYDENENAVSKRKIQTENIFNNEVLVSNGLKAGEIIAIAGVTYLYDGQAVTLLDVGTKKFN